MEDTENPLLDPDVIDVMWGSERSDSDDSRHTGEGPGVGRPIETLPGITNDTNSVANDYDVDGIYVCGCIPYSPKRRLGHHR